MPAPLSFMVASTMLAAAVIAQEVAPGQQHYIDLLAHVARWQEQDVVPVRRVPIGTSVGGRDLFVLRIGDAPDTAPEVYVGAGIHGGEGTCHDVVFLVEQVLRHGAEGATAGLLRTRVLWVQPMVNPDGLVALRRTNERHVDLNRNFPVRWKARQRSHVQGSHGAEPFSEPETRAVRDFLRARPRLSAYLDLHRSVRMLVVPHDEDAEVDPRALAEAERLDAAMRGYSSRSGVKLPALILPGISSSGHQHRLGAERVRRAGLHARIRRTRGRGAGRRPAVLVPRALARGRRRGVGLAGRAAVTGAVSPAVQVATRCAPRGERRAWRARRP